SRRERTVSRGSEIVIAYCETKRTAARNRRRSLPRGFATSRPSQVTRPELGRSSPLRVDSKVVLPAPEAPSSPSGGSPACTARSMPCSTASPGYPACRELVMRLEDAGIGVFLAADGPDAL